MNTRLQVEHPVTEALTGYDLVEWQLRVARGESLPEVDQEAILRRFETGGHAIEARLCAEDPDHDFLPQSGRLLAWQPADTVRVDHALQTGHRISPFYDSMVAKFIAHGADRDTARQRLADALADTCVLGVQTNQAYLAATLQHPVFARGQATTGFIPAHGATLLAQTPAMPVAMAALVLYAARAWQGGHDPTTVVLPLAWSMPMRLSIDALPHRADIISHARQPLPGGVRRHRDGAAPARLHGHPDDAGIAAGKLAGVLGARTAAIVCQRGRSPELLA